MDWRLFDAQRAAAWVVPGVRAIIRGWLGRISASANAVRTAFAEAAAFDHLCAVAGLEEPQAMAALDELRNRQLLLEADDVLPALGRDPGWDAPGQTGPNGHTARPPRSA